MDCIERWKPVSAMVGVEFCFAVINILLKKALDGGVSQVMIVAYRQTISTIILIPLAYYYERSSWSKLTVQVIGQIFLCSLLGLTLSQYLFLVGLEYTSATFTCAFINLVPVITFLLALPFGMEKLNMKINSGKAKVLGTLTCLAGALVLTLYKGIPITQPHASVNQENAKGWGMGSAFLTAGSLCWSSWFLLQARVGKHYPYSYSSMTIMSFFSAVQSVILGLITDRKFSNWILKGELQILTVIIAGVVGSGLCYVVMSWCVKQRGPVFTSAFSPLIQIFASIFDVVLLHEEIYLGSILGSIVVIIGMYILLWGKSNDEETRNDDVIKINANYVQDLPVEVIINE